MFTSTLRRSALAASLLPLVGSVYAGPQDRADTYGAIQYLPQSTEAYVGIYDVEDAAKRFLKADCSSIIRKALQDNGMTVDGLFAEEEFAQALPFIGKELFLAVGQGTAAQTGNLLDVAEASNYVTGLQLAMMIKGVLQDEYVNENQAYIDYFMDNKDTIIGLLEKAEMPPLIIGSKMDADTRAEVVAQLGQGLQMAPLFLNQEVEVVSAVTVEQGGSEFSGLKFSGAALMTQFGEDLEAGLNEMLDEADAKRVITALKDNNLTILYGQVGDYLMFSLTSDPEDFTLAGGLGESLASSDDLAFLDDYAGKDPVTLLYGTKDMVALNEKYGSIFADLFLGFKDGIVQEAILGDTEELEITLEDAAKQDRGLFTDRGFSRFGAVSYIEDGWKGESFGGLQPLLVKDKKVTLDELADKKDALLVSVSASDDAGTKKVMDYLSTIAELGFMVAEKAAAVDSDDRDFQEFKQAFALFDAKFKKDAFDIIDAIKTDLGGGLKNQTALVIDGKGDFPPLPDVPNEVVKNGQLPRIAWVAEVEDRAKVTRSWERIDSAVENVIASISEMTGESIPAFKPMNAENDGLTTYFYGMPFFSGGLNPSSAVSDQLFMLSTSTDLSKEIAKQVDTDAGEITGSYFQLNFSQLGDYGNGWVQLLEEHGKAFMGEYEYEDFIDNKAYIDSAIESVKSLGGLKVHSRVEGGESRTSVHFSGK